MESLRERILREDWSWQIAQLILALLLIVLLLLFTRCIPITSIGRSLILGRDRSVGNPLGGSPGVGVAVLLLRPRPGSGGGGVRRHLLQQRGERIGVLALPPLFVAFSVFLVFFILLVLVLLVFLMLMLLMLLVFFTVTKSRFLYFRFLKIGIDKLTTSIVTAIVITKSL